jgi:hypothetical protein
MLSVSPDQKIKIHGSAEDADEVKFLGLWFKSRLEIKIWKGILRKIKVQRQNSHCLRRARFAQGIHVLEVTDNGSPSLSSYERLILW